MTHWTAVPSALLPSCTSTHLVVSPLGWMAVPVGAGGAVELVEDAEEVREAEEEEVDDAETDEVELGEGPELSALMRSAARSD